MKPEQEHPSYGITPSVLGWLGIVVPLLIAAAVSPLLFAAIQWITVLFE